MYFALCGRLRQLFVFSALCLTALLNAQQTYEAGYLVTSDGGRQQVDILNLDWRYTPTKITVLRGGEPTVIAVSALNEFGIPGKAHFVNYTVQMERSSTETSALPSAPTPLRQERLLLRAEVAGPASLYSYSEQQVTKFFLQLDSTTPPTQLVYQRWVTATNKVRENKQYALQLMSALQCGTHSSKQTPGYELRELREIAAVLTIGQMSLTQYRSMS